MEQDKSEKVDEKDGEIARIGKELAEASKKAETLEKSLKDQDTEIKELLGQKQKALESKEKVELTAITEKYQELEQNSQNIAEQLEIKNQAISDYIRLIYQQDQQTEIFKIRLAGEITQKGLTAIKIARLEQNNLHLSNKILTETGKLQTKINSKDRIIKDQDDALVSLTKNRTDLTNLLKTRDDELSKADQEYKELEKDLKTPEIIHNFLY